MRRSRHLIAAQALMTAGKLHPDKIAKAARAASMKGASVRNTPGAADGPCRHALSLRFNPFLS
jgi:hypothetical protein